MTVATKAPEALAAGLHREIPMDVYLAQKALGSTHLDWLARSPKHYRYLMSQPAEATKALTFGTAFHTALLEPALFERLYEIEPEDLSKIAGADAKSPRATKAYKTWAEDVRQGGFSILHHADKVQIDAMVQAVQDHEPARNLLQGCPERELTVLWDRNGRRMRSRVDMLGRDRLGDVKTTSSLSDFSPWAITRYGYHRQMALLEEGLMHHDRAIELFYFLVIEKSPPYDVGVFYLDVPEMEVGRRSCTRLLELLDECERQDRWPGMFPEPTPARLTDEALASSGDDQEAA